MSNQPTHLVLEVCGADGQKRYFDLASDALTIGRTADCDVQLDSVRVSRCHARLIPDPSGAWLIRDMASRNGMRINGHTATENLLQSTDVVQIEEWELRVRPRRELEHDGTETTRWSAETEPDASGFTTLFTSPNPRLEAAHLAMVSALGQRLAEIPQDRQRLTYLCRALVEADMRCSTAVVLRVNRVDFRQSPQLLCPVQFRNGCAAPRIVRGIVEAAVNGERPILAGGALASGLTINFAEERPRCSCFHRLPPAHRGGGRRCVVRHRATPMWNRRLAGADHPCGRAVEKGPIADRGPPQHAGQPGPAARSEKGSGNSDVPGTAKCRRAGTANRHRI